jgi:methylase of polypeptide subunit release factors
VCRVDVARGLRPGAFDLVTANPPWMPDLAGAAEPGALAYAEGGPTGFELPRRFVMEAASLLAPGGVSISLLIDSTWRDGQQPLARLARGLQRLRFATEIVPTGAEEAWPAMVRSTLARVPGMASTRHVALIVRRPS